MQRRRKPRIQINLTDEDSRIMPVAGGGCLRAITTKPLNPAICMPWVGTDRRLNICYSNAQCLLTHSYEDLLHSSSSPRNSRATIAILR
jgi:hypothetical protein